MHKDKKYTLGFSPCPNDTYLFDAMVNHKIDTEGIDFELIIEDVEALNQLALKGKLDFTKLSFNAYKSCYQHYTIMDTGSALGFGCGPLLIKKPEIKLNNDSLIGIPGQLTTANYLLNRFFPDYQNKSVMLFSDIMTGIQIDTIQAGLIIHESRFTYQKYGFEKVADLGELWEQQTASPIPLGGIMANKNLASEDVNQVDKLMKRSLEYAKSQHDQLSNFVKFHAQEMNEEVMKSHIALYVNEFTYSLSELGERAIEEMIYQNPQPIKKTHKIFTHK